MKKIALLCALVLLVGLLPLSGVLAENEPVRVRGLIGPTGMSLAPMFSEYSRDYTIELSAAPEEMAGIVASGDYDIAALPTNLAAILYQKTKGSLQMLAVNTLGVLYVLEKGNSIQTVKDLAGKTITLSGQNATPEYALNYILAVNGVEAALDFKSEHNEVSTLAASGKADIVMLPQPMVTALLMKDSSYRVALDITREFAAAAQMDGKPETVFSMGCLVVRREFAQQRPEDLKTFMQRYMEAVAFVNAEPAKAAEAIAEFGILPNAKIAEKAIPLCNIVYMDGEEMKAQLAPLFDILFSANPASVGGQVPDDGFYYIAK